jgi:intein-encoded DNA endonuclease-like protein
MEIPNQIVRDYQSGRTLPQLVREYNIPYTTLHDNLQEIIKLRDKSSGKVQVNLTNSKELWYVIGVLFGDGSAYSYRHHQCKNAKFFRIELDCKDREFADEFFKCCKAIGLHPFLTTRKSETTKQGFQWKVYTNSKTFVEWFEKFKLTYRAIPTLPKKYKIAFIRGVFDSEGCKYKNSAKITNTKVWWIGLVREILNSLGFETSAYYTENGFCKKYDISILGGKLKVREFLTLVNSSIPRKM